MGQKEGADAAAYAAQRRVEAGKLKALQTDTAMREELFRTMGNIDAVRAAANADLNSPTIFAIKQNTRGNMDTTAGALSEHRIASRRGPGGGEILSVLWAARDARRIAVRWRSTGVWPVRRDEGSNVGAPGEPRRVKL